MKNLIFYLIASILFVSCNKDEKDSNTSILGFYQCNVKENRYSIDSDSVYTEEYIDTVEIKNINDTVYSISSIGKINVAEDLSFSGYHISGKFYDDSIYFYYFLTPVGLINYTYQGKKL
jgi:hypothetical protein